MSKATKNERISTLERQVTALITLVKMKGYNESEPQLKQLDQSVFNGAHEMWKFASVDADGAGFRFAERPELTDRFWRNINCSRFDRLSQSGAYDASNWQNSLIERDKVELTGSDLCRAMLERGDKYVMCAYDNGYDNHPKAISVSEYGDLFYINGDYKYGVLCGNIYPINNQGEPLTASEAGL